MRLLALIPPGTNARSIYSDFLRGWQLAGHSVFFEDVCAFIADSHRRGQGGGEAASRARSEAGTLMARHVESLVRTLRCDAIVALGADPFLLLPWVPGASGGAASFVEVVHVPVIHFWLDAPFWACGGALLPVLDRDRFASPWHVHLVNNEGTAEEMRKVLGLRTVVASPYGVDGATFRPWPRVSRDFDLAFCAGPGDPPPSRLMLQELEKDQPDAAMIRHDEGERAIAPLTAAICAAAPGAARDVCARLARAWIGEQVRDPDRPMLAKFGAASSAIPDAAEPVTALTSRPTSAVHWAAASAIVRRADSWQRAFYAAYLSARFRTLFIGAGAAEWQRAGWPIQGQRAGFLGYHEMSVCYSRAAAGVNVMRYQDDVGFNPKGLEIAGSGTVAVQRKRLSGDQSALPLADRTEGVWFDSPADAAARIRELLADAGQRESICSAGAERVRREHTWEARARTLGERIEPLIRGLA